MSTKKWLVWTIAVVLSLLFGWHEWSELFSGRWSDHTYLELIFLGIMVALFEGGSLVKRLGREQRDRIESIAEEQRKTIAILERLEHEHRKLNRQQVSNLILIEQVVASLPSVSGPASELE